MSKQVTNNIPLTIGQKLLELLKLKKGLDLPCQKTRHYNLMQINKAARLNESTNTKTYAEVCLEENQQCIQEKK